MIKVTIEDEKEQKVLEGTLAFGTIEKTRKGEGETFLAGNGSKADILTCMARACTNVIMEMEFDPESILIHVEILANAMRERVVEKMKAKKEWDDEEMEMFHRYAKAMIEKRFHER